MYFYSSLILISNILILTVQTKQTEKSPGISACSYSNYFDNTCNMTSVKISEIPDECSSMFFDGFYVDLNNNIFANADDPKENKVFLDSLDNILTSSKCVYVYYGHASQSEWAQLLEGEASCGGTKSLAEMKCLGAFMNEHPGITGVILTALENRDHLPEFPGFSENLKTYLKVMKTSFPDLVIGMQFAGTFIIDQYTNPKIPWLDFKVIEPATDFFIISAQILNDCTDESLYNTGSSPMTSSTTDYTMEKIKFVLPQLSIRKEKLYFKYKLDPLTKPDDTNSPCKWTLQEMCENPSGTCDYCSDTMESFYEKGKFAYENGAGFITSDIQFGDPKNKCKCEKPFGSFYALLNGFQSGILKPCEAFPRK